MSLDPPGLSTQSENPWGWIYGLKISAHVPDGGMTSARAVPVPVMVRPAASPIAASAPASFLIRLMSRPPDAWFLDPDSRTLAGPPGTALKQPWNGVSRRVPHAAAGPG